MTSDSTILSVITSLPSHILPLHTVDGSQLADRIYYFSHTHLAFSITCSTLMHKPHIQHRLVLCGILGQVRGLVVLIGEIVPP